MLLLSWAQARAKGVQFALTPVWSDHWHCQRPTAGNKQARATEVGSEDQLVPFEISNSMNPYPAVFHARTSELRLVIVCLSRTISMRLPTRFLQPLTISEAQECP